MIITTRLIAHYTTVLKGLRNYKDSPAQAHLYDYIRNENELK